MKSKKLIHTLPVRLREDDKARLETLADSWGVSLAEATRMAIESEHLRYQDERQESRFEMILSDQKKVLNSINQSRLRLEQLFSYFCEFEKRMYAHSDDKVITKLNELEPYISDTFVRVMAMVRSMQARPQIEAEIQKLIQGK